MKITRLPSSASASASASSSSSKSISIGGGSSSTAETKPEDTWRNLVARLDICERCIIAAMIADLAVEVAAMAFWPFRRAPGVSIDVLGNVILGGLLCLPFMYIVLLFYVQWKAVLARSREVELTSASSTSASDLV